MSSYDDQFSSASLLKLVFPVIIIWGGNFAVMRVGVHDIGPFLLAALRFFIAAVPLIFFVRRPQVPFLFIAAYGMTFGLGQFGFLFVCIKLGLPSGLASLIVQLQVVFTPLLALVVLRQRIPKTTLGAIAISLVGLSLILLGTGHGHVAVIPVILGTAAALSWGASNVIVAWGASHGYDYNPVALVIWASSLLPAPFLGAAFIAGEFNSVTSTGLLSALIPALYLGAIATVMAYHLWVRALSSYPAATVAPFSLLIPIIGLSLGWVIFGETLNGSEAIGCALVIAGVVVHISGLRIRSYRARRSTKIPSPRHGATRY
jgi:O-acetylserine/cysteine efflux transporter